MSSFLELYHVLTEKVIDPSKDYIRENPNWKNDLAQKWRNQTGIELIYPEPDRSVLNDMWDNWQQMPNNLKSISDKKSLELFGLTNQKHYSKLITNPTVTKYEGYRFILHRHNPRNGSIHYDLRFMDLRNNKLLHSFAAPSNFLDLIKTNQKSAIYKTRDHDPRWLDLKSYRLETIDEGYVDYKVYKPAIYFQLDFHGKIINGEKIIFKLKDRRRDDVWLFTSKKR